MNLQIWGYVYKFFSFDFIFLQNLKEAFVYRHFTTGWK